ncbi:Mdj2p PWA37_002485 [Arxiozyma heterogenica]|uniref:J domain-containing protein n=1 Tax=Arxiozyma heterogenica TaxID=278026 RepID=A0AAN7WI44_9SACH|nr:hypothetical protein RI543_005092 [Kazachstania heterogenica]
MVLPILIGCGVTVLALSIQSSFRAWNVYKTLTPITIAKLNGIKFNQVHSDLSSDPRFLSNNINPILRKNLEQYYGGFGHIMNESEALLILNISSEEIKDLDSEMLKRKYRKALILNHPDKGGSPYVTTKINEARELLFNSVLVRKQ